MGVEFLTINVLLYTKSEQKKIGIKISTPIIFKNPLKPDFLIRNILLQFVSGMYGYFLFEKQTFNGLLKVKIYFEPIYSVQFIH